MDKGKVTNQKFTRLTTLLKELFQLDQPELDFGLYRVMHARAKEVTQFLENDLLPQVSAVFEQYKSGDAANIQEELNEAISRAKELGANPDTLPKVQELRAKLDSGAVDVSRLESEVYDHLHTFFRRYYHEGDFLSRRVYKDGVYAIPYSGEEVKLHWANADQYYIKTDEYLKNFTFRLNPSDEKNPLRVHFRIKNAAEGEHGNIKAQENADRRFILCKEDFIEEIDGETGNELAIYFEYRPAELNDWDESERSGKKSPPAQKDLIAIAVKRISVCDGRQIQKWLKPLLAKAPTEKDRERTVLDKHLDQYTKRNTFDYFIHKDLGGFLRRELDFYIKNEVMHLDDIENETAAKVEQYLSKIKAIRKVAGKIIDFLAQLENFQKKLWLKKKFVVETNYCITLDRIPEEFYPEIAANEEQRKEWVKLFAIDEIKGDLVTPGYSEPLHVEFLKRNQSLLIDTKFFDSKFIANLLNTEEFRRFNNSGLLVNSDNSNALRFIGETYRGKIRCIYIDPPYNTPHSEILYKNDYKHSSWISLVDGSLQQCIPLLGKTYGLGIAIDDFELINLGAFLDSVFVNCERSMVVVNHHPQGAGGRLSRTHEYMIMLSPQGAPAYLGEPIDDYQEERSFMRSGTAENNFRSGRWRSFYALLLDPKRGVLVGVEEPVPLGDVFPTGETPEGYIRIYPINSRGEERVWRSSYETGRNRVLNGEIAVSSTRTVYQLIDHEAKRQVLFSNWTDSKFNAGTHGSSLLNEMGLGGLFDYPKSINTVETALWALSYGDPEATILDFYGGSGTTAHAVLNLNRKDSGRRQFVLIEVGEHFECVIKPRVLKSIYSKEWSNKRPVHRTSNTSSSFKYLRLESYEDALNNLESKRPAQAQLTLDSKQSQGTDGFKEQYTLKYMLDVETKGSQSLLNIQDFKDPTAYKMLIKRPGTDESKLVNVDLIETFNWLLGLTVDHIAAPQTFTATFKRDEEKRLVLGSQLKQTDNGNWWFRTVTGKDPEGRNVLVVWRKRPGGDEPEGIEQDNLILNEWFRKLGFSTKDREFDLIYVNGTNNLENVRTADEYWKVRLIEEDFIHLMFDVEEV